MDRRQNSPRKLICKIVAHLSHPLSLFPSKKVFTALSFLDYPLELLHVTRPLEHSTYPHTRAQNYGPFRPNKEDAADAPLIRTPFAGPKQTAHALKLDRLSCSRFERAAVIDTLYEEDGQDERRGNRRARLTCATDRTPFLCTASVSLPFWVGARGVFFQS